MKIKRTLSLILAAVLMLSFSGCRNREENNGPEQNQQTAAEDELVIYHNDKSIAPMLMTLAEEYSAATGNKISAKLAGNDFAGEIKSNSGVLYVVDSHSDLSDWHSEGLLTDIMNHEGFSSAIPGVPAGLQLNPAGIGSYGIPLVLEGYGYIFDREMITALFGEENTEKLINDLRTCSFADFEGFVAAVDTYISAPSAAKITLNGNEYSFLPEKTGKAAELKGVFSLNSESSRAAEHLLSYALAAKFKSHYEVMSAAEEAVSGMEKVFGAYMEVLDLHTGHIAGAEGSISRGDEFTGGDYNYSTSIDLLTRGNALFYPGGTSDAADFEKSSEGFSENLDIIPMKLPLSAEDISVEGMTEEKLQSSIVISSRYYIAINPKADEKDISAAKDFVDWLYNDEAGKTAFSKAFGAVPFNFEYLMGGNSENGSSGSGSSGNENSESGSSGSGNSGTGSSENGNSGAGDYEAGSSGDVGSDSGNSGNGGSGNGKSGMGSSGSGNSGMGSSGNGKSGAGSSESGTSENKAETESGTVSPEDSSPSGTGKDTQAGYENENSQSSGETGSSSEENPEQGMTPSHSISNSLMMALGNYYAAGNWIPDLSFALPEDFIEDILGKNLSDYWGKETWADSDRKSFIDELLGGWKEKLDKSMSAVG